MTTERVVAVFGYSRRWNDELDTICADRLACAERLSEGACAVVLSGSREAELMRSAWTGPNMLLICDLEARSTADNAANVAAAARELGAEELVVVTSPWHRTRVRILVWAALRGSGIRFSIATAEGARPRLLLARELACLALMPFQLRRARPMTWRRLRGGRAHLSQPEASADVD